MSSSMSLTLLLLQKVVLVGAAEPTTPAPTSNEKDLAVCAHGDVAGEDGCRCTALTCTNKNRVGEKWWGDCNEGTTTEASYKCDAEQWCDTTANRSTMACLNLSAKDGTRCVATRKTEGYCHLWGDESYPWCWTGNGTFDYAWCSPDNKNQILAPSDKPVPTTKKPQTGRNAECFKVGVFYNQMPFATEDAVRDASGCQAKCRRKWACRFWTYNVKSKQCYMMTQLATGKLGPGVPNAKFTSGPRRCDEWDNFGMCGKRLGETFQDNVAYQGKMLIVAKVDSSTQHTINSAEGCQKECGQYVERCEQFTWRQENKTCVLNKLVNATPEDLVGATSGRRPCHLYDRGCSNKYELGKAYGPEGHLKTVQNIASAEDCRKACGAHVSKRPCKAFTYRKCRELEDFRDDYEYYMSDDYNKKGCNVCTLRSAKGKVTLKRHTTSGLRLCAKDGACESAADCTNASHCCSKSGFCGSSPTHCDEFQRYPSNKNTTLPAIAEKSNNTTPLPTPREKSNNTTPI